MSKFNISEFDVIADVIATYCEMRADLPRVKAIKEVLSNFEDELNDCDDRPFIYVGLAQAILENGEKIPTNIKNNVLISLSSENFQERFLENETIKEDFLIWLENFKNQVEHDISLQKPVKVYKKFNFKNWKKGDLFCFTGDVPEIPNFKAIYFYVEDIVMLDNCLSPIVYPYITKNFQFVDKDKFDMLIPLACRAHISSKDDSKHMLYRHVFISNKFTKSETYELQYIGNYPEFIQRPYEYDSDILFYNWVSLDRIPENILRDIRVMEMNNLFPDI